MANAGEEKAATSCSNTGDITLEKNCGMAATAADRRESAGRTVSTMEATSARVFLSFSSWGAINKKKIL